MASVDSLPRPSDSTEPEADFSGADVAQELEAARLPELHLQPIRDQLLLDFYLSFKFSQSGEGVQTELFGALLKEYRRAGSEPTSEDIAAVKEKLSNLKPPTQHRTMPDTWSSDFTRMWGKLEDTLRLKLGGRLHESELQAIGKGMVERDIGYQDRARPNRDSGDEHESFFRTYVLEGKPTRSATYDSIMTQVGSACAEAPPWRPIVQELVELKAAWEYNHPGEKFYPEPAPKLAE